VNGDVSQNAELAAIAVSNRIDEFTHANILLGKIQNGIVTPSLP
jgi:hypothetical protein